MKIIKVEPRSPEWHEIRKTIIGLGCLAVAPVNGTTLEVGSK